MLQRKTDGGYNIQGRMARVDKTVRGTGVWEAIRYFSSIDTPHLWPRSRLYFGCTSTAHHKFFDERWKIVLRRVGTATSNNTYSKCLS